MESDWGTLLATLNFVNQFSQSTLSDGDDLYNKMLNYKNCIGDHCGIDIKRIF
ncbi:unnamed protein product [Oikopleura dioica]|nr:unnamed protein product [Oikopleura dioica]